eukprot:5696039-Pyramimonas_sp.AAC.1
MLCLLARVPTVAINGCVGIASRWKSMTARTFSSKLCRIRLDLSRPRLINKFWSVKPRGPSRPDWTEKKLMQLLRTFGR